MRKQEATAAQLRSEMRVSARECARSYSLCYGQTLRVRSLYPNIRTLPPADSVAEILHPWLRTDSPLRLLDVGASDIAEAKARMAQEYPAVEYKSFDIDRNTQQDYYSWEEVEGRFDRVRCTEVVEHLPFCEALELLENMYQCLRPGGVLLLSTPNTFNPTRFLQHPSHRTPWCYDQLAGVLLAQGFDLLNIHRYGGLRRPKGIKDLLLSRLADAVAWRLRIDAAFSICVTAQRPLDATHPKPDSRNS